MNKENTIPHTCNVTGKKFFLDNSEKHREMGLRFECNCRHRAIIYFLTKKLYDEPKILSEVNENKKINGIGMSDSGFDILLKEKFSYTNTFYHQHPFLDIYNNKHVDTYKNLDFIICSDVFEHINPHPDIQIAFNNLYKMLKPGGFVIFSVPYNDKAHMEHYPSLFKYSIEFNDGEYLVQNETINGKKEIFSNPIFHGGPGATLEMRQFSKDSIINYFNSSGFSKIEFNEIEEDLNQYGIYWHTDLDLIITATK